MHSCCWPSNDTPDTGLLQPDIKLHALTHFSADLSVMLLRERFVDFGLCTMTILCGCNVFSAITRHQSNVLGLDCETNYQVACKERNREVDILGEGSGRVRIQETLGSVTIIFKNTRSDSTACCTQSAPVSETHAVFAIDWHLGGIVDMASKRE